MGSLLAAESPSWDGKPCILSHCGAARRVLRFGRQRGRSHRLATTESRAAPAHQAPAIRASPCTSPLLRILRRAMMHKCWRRQDAGSRPLAAFVRPCTSKTKPRHDGRGFRCLNFVLPALAASPMAGHGVPTTRALHPAMGHPDIPTTFTHVTTPDPDVATTHPTVISGCPDIAAAYADLLVARCWRSDVDINIDISARFGRWRVSGPGCTKAKQSDQCKCTSRHRLSPFVDGMPFGEVETTTRNMTGNEAETKKSTECEDSFS